MSETKWQPGPWRRDPKKFDDLVDATGRRVTFGRLVLSAGFSADMAQAVEANTVLAEAAPDLYRELYHLVTLLAAKGEYDMDVPGLATLNGARNALAKARGES